MKIVIIGGGVAGLAAGIYAQRNGLDSEIHEKHFALGGQCAYWKRKGYTLDNCVHWLTGTDPATEMYKVWEDLSVLGPDLPVIQHPTFLQLEHGGVKINLWQDVERMRREFKELSPADAHAIDDFMDGIHAFKDVVLPTIPDEMMSLRFIFGMLRKMKGVAALNRRYSKMAIADFAARFRHPVLRKMCTAYLPDKFNVTSLFYTYATFCSGNGALPAGGSRGMIERMEALYRSLGGKVVTSHEAESLVIEGRKATGVKFKDGSIVTADQVIPACDTFETFHHLVPRELMVPYFRKRYGNPQKYPVYTTFNCYFALKGKASGMMEQNTHLIEGELDLLGTGKDSFLVKNFDYEPDFAPEGCSVLQTMVSLYEDDYEKWTELYRRDRAGYKAAKEGIAMKMAEYLERRFPEMAGKLELLDVATPVTHHRFCNAYKGSYMSFIYTPFIKKKSHDGRIKGLDNVVLAGQWLQMPGGLPNAAVTGRFAICRILKKIIE